LAEGYADGSFGDDSHVLASAWRAIHLARTNEDPSGAVIGAGVCDAIRGITKGGAIFNFWKPDAVHGESSHCFVFPKVEQGPPCVPPSALTSPREQNGKSKGTEK
jgi:hypothetical protein